MDIKRSSGLIFHPTSLPSNSGIGELNKNKKIIIVDSQLAGEGASSRNSGYLVDTTLNDGFTSDKDLNNYKKKYFPPNSFVNLLNKKFTPYCSVATWYLWRSIDNEPIQY